MPITLAKMAAHTASVTVQYLGESVTVVYYPDKINSAVLVQLDGNSEAITEALAAIIKSWDFYEDDETTVMFPIDADRLKELGWPFRVAIREAIVEDMRPNSRKPQE